MTNWISGETSYFNSFILGLESPSTIPNGYLFLGAIILYTISKLVVIFINPSYTNESYIWIILLWGCTGLLMFFYFFGFYMMGSDILGFDVVPQIGFYLRHVSWLVLGIPLFYLFFIVILKMDNF